MHESYNNSRPVVNLVRREMPLGTPLFETSPQRGRMLVSLILFALIALSLFLFLNTSDFFDRFQGRFSADNSDSSKIRIYAQQLESLQNKMTVFIADSVETKLRALEKNVSAGTVGAQEIKTFEELKNELILLGNYTAGQGGNLTDLSRLEHTRFQVTPGSQLSPTNSELLGELVHLKNLLYISIASCGLAVIMVGGYWWQHQLSVRRLQVIISKVPMLPGSTPQESD